MAFNTLGHRNIAQVNRVFERFISLVAGFAFAIRQPAEVHRVLNGLTLQIGQTPVRPQFGETGDDFLIAAEKSPAAIPCDQSRCGDVQSQNVRGSSALRDLLLGGLVSFREAQVNSRNLVGKPVRTLVIFEVLGAQHGLNASFWRASAFHQSVIHERNDVL